MMFRNRTMVDAEVTHRALSYLQEPWAGPPMRVLAVLAHPDDEVLALGGRLEWLHGLTCATVTDGAPRDGADAAAHGFGSLEAYRAARHLELRNAMAHAGLDEQHLVLFPVAVGDQQASLMLREIAGGVSELLERLRPEMVLTHPYEGGHPDHDACAFAVQQAVLTWGAAVPVLEAPFYHACEHGEMRTGEFLSGQTVPTVTCALHEEQQRNKRARLAMFPSQAQTLAQFGVAQESYRLAPAYDFTRRPHTGQLLYERFPWGMQGKRFCELARLALAGETTAELPQGSVR